MFSIWYVFHTLAKSASESQTEQCIL